jgi:hypothetical protein
MGTEMSGSNAATTNFTLRAHFKAEARHYRERERFLRKQAATQHRVTHVKPERGVMLLGYGKRNGTVRACRAFEPITPNRGGTQAPKRMSLARRVQIYGRHRSLVSDGAYARHLTPRQYRQLSRMETLDARDEDRRRP